MRSMRTKSFVFTGWHMVVVMTMFFGTIISVNFYMAWQATHSWSGLVVPNTYIASQEFNGKVAEAKALAATGLTGKVEIEGGEIRYRISHTLGKPVAADTLTLHFRRPVGEHQDFDVTLAPLGGGLFAIAHDVLPGTWIIEADASQAGERILHHTERVLVRGAAR
ncbi:MAG: FixH family protein [Pseudorhizobium pelagicum]|uniref:FixH family protein n=1 Tax=Pseudorhizobium pelagicum TaxID=1509405 RepID=UPI00346110C7